MKSSLKNYVTSLKSNLSKLKFYNLVICSNSLQKFKRSPDKNLNISNAYYKKKILSKNDNSKKDKFCTARRAVKEFFLNDENSTQTPGVKDYITKNKIKKRKRHLTDTVHNLYLKFCRNAIKKSSGSECD